MDKIKLNTEKEDFKSEKCGSCDLIRVTRLHQSTGWKEIAAGIKNGTLTMDIGSTVTCTLANGTLEEFVVTDVTEQYVRFETKNLIGKNVVWNKQDTSKGGYPESYIKEDVDSVIWNLLPEDLKEVIDDAKREWTDRDGNRDTYTTKLFLPAASEIFEAEDCLGDKRVYTQLEYYKDVKNRIRVDEYDSPRGYWLASVLREDPRVCTVDSHGLPDYFSTSHPFLYKTICFHISKSYGKNKMGMIQSFRGKYSFLSNFYTAPVVWDGITYCNSEAAFQSAKCVNQADRDAFAGLSASEAKRLGRQVKLRDDWELVKEDVMYEICLAKFSQNTKLKEKLLLTGNDLLVEGNTYGDQFWGVVNGVGQNKLGKILMKVRDVLHNEE